MLYFFVGRTARRKKKLLKLAQSIKSISVAPGCRGDSKRVDEESWGAASSIICKFQPFHYFLRMGFWEDVVVSPGLLSLLIAPVSYLIS